MVHSQVDLRLSPMDKPKPPAFPKKDPMAVLLPLFDSYPSAARAENMDNPRLSPIVSHIDKLPQDMFLVIAGIDILLHEQLTFVERVKRDFERKGISEAERRIVGKVYDKGFHGWLEREFPPFHSVLLLSHPFRPMLDRVPSLGNSRRGALLM
jgi:hypothetical protein